MNEPDFIAAGGNVSATHVDFVIGSGELDIDGLRADGAGDAQRRMGVENCRERRTRRRV